MSPRRAFTLVELLVVVAIIGALVALLLPAIQAAREAARKRQCSSHLRQLAIACLNHETAHGHFPTGGWGYQWIGEPDRGYGVDQPGGWAYNILDYIEQPALRKLGAGIADDTARQEQLKILVTTPVALFNCPTKRPLQGFPIDPRFASLAVNLWNCGPHNGCLVARSDYRANAGAYQAGDVPGPGPQQDPATFPWADPDSHNGVTFQRSMVRVKQITDGASRTYLLGEKALTADRYFDGSYTADDQCAYSGHDNDNAGYTGKKRDEIYVPLRDWPPRNADTKFRFGGPHEDGFFMAMCDGSVHFTAFEIEELAFWRLGGRNDEEN
jgi:prepilin-type N-terminal cleavage/methylation domain-containing protein